MDLPAPGRPDGSPNEDPVCGDEPRVPAAWPTPAQPDSDAGNPTTLTVDADSVIDLRRERAGHSASRRYKRLAKAWRVRVFGRRAPLYAFAFLILSPGY
jgi:hypothetical protein